MEVCGILTADSPDEALGVVSAVVVPHDHLFTTLIVSVARAVADARVWSVWSTNARVTAAACEETKNEIKYVIFAMRMLRSHRPLILI